MEDLAGKLNELLNDPEIMKQIKDLSGSFGNQEGNNEQVKPESKEHNSESSSNSIPGLDGFSPEMLSTIAKLVPILSSFNQEDKYTSFLQSLRPLLSEPRKRKLDESSKFLKLMQILPILKDKDII